MRPYISPKNPWEGGLWRHTKVITKLEFFFFPLGKKEKKQTKDHDRDTLEKLSKLPNEAQTCQSFKLYPPQTLDSK